jgi:hypothetical protein
MEMSPGGGTVAMQIAKLPSNWANVNEPRWRNRSNANCEAPVQLGECE